MRSAKLVKPLEETLLPFTFTPTKDLSGNVNGEAYHFVKGKPATVTMAQFEAILHAGYDFRKTP